MASRADRSQASESPTGRPGRAMLETHAFADDGPFPHRRLPGLVYRGVLATPRQLKAERAAQRKAISEAVRRIVEPE